MILPYKNHTEANQYYGVAIASRVFSLLWIALFLSLVLFGSGLQAQTSESTSLDLVIASGSGENNGICLGNGTGALLSCSDLADTESDDATDIAIGDINNDNISDLVFANRHENKVCLGTPQGRFPSCQPISGTDRVSTGVGLGDINSDGLLDAVFSNKGFGSQLCYGSADGSPVNCDDIPLIVSNVEDVALGDLNNDGRIDAIFANGLALLNNELCLAHIEGAYNSCQVVFEISGGTAEIELADFNDDGNLDAFFAQFSGNAEVCLGTGRGTFSTCIEVEVSRARDVAVADFSGDGILDLVLFSDMAYLCLGVGDGNFPTCRVFGSANLAALDLAVGDMNGDGNLDVVLVGSAEIMICLGNGFAEFTSCESDLGAFHAGRVVQLGRFDLE